MDGIYFHVIVAGTIVVSSGHHITASTTPVPANNAPAATWAAWRAANLDADGKTKIGLFSDGNIDVNGGVSMTAQLFTNNKVTLNGGGGNKQNIVGGIVSSELDIKVNGGYNIHYTEIATIGVIEEFESDTPEGVRLVDWAEF
jgi:hypothetical protein